MATSRLRAWLGRPIDPASLAVFRIAFGTLMLIAVVRFFVHDWIAEYYLTPTHFFTYRGFGWVKPWPGHGMYVHFAVMGACAALIIVGLWYRVATALFTVLFAYAHLIDKTNYLNHYYLLICLGALMTVLPLHACASIDAWRSERVRRLVVPAWALYAIRLQLGLVYFFGGIAKLKYDWLVDAQPMQIWLSANTDFPVVGRYFSEPAVAYVFSWAGLVFDLGIVPCLLWRRTRAVAYAAVVVFHVTTAQLFHIGMFPWIMMASSLIFLPPSWPRRLLRLRAWPPGQTATWRPRLVPAVLATYFAIQLVLPLRHFAYPGNVCWTEEGFRFAWHVMVMEKDGSLELHVREPSTGRHWEVAPTDYLTRYQARMMATQPDMILELAHIVADDFRTRGIVDPEVRVDAFASLDGRRRMRLVDPTVDLARETDSLMPASWILPLSDAAPASLVTVNSQHGARP